MKKIFICSFALLGGLATGVIYWLCKKREYDNTASKLTDEKVDFKPKPQKEYITQTSNTVDEMCQAKSESSQNIHERHLAASEIMKDAYSNIMEDFVENLSDEKFESEENNTQKSVIDSEDISVMEKLNLISNDIDDILK